VLSVDIKKALPGFTLDVTWEAGQEVVALFGASGAGKSLTLQCLAGLARPDRGRITLRGRLLFDASAPGRPRVDVPARERRVGYVFQGYALFPHLSVEENIAFGLHAVGRAERRRRVAELVARLGLAGLERQTPGALSGGQQQRVALGRALARDPEVVLLDEPFSALDAPLRRQLRDELGTLLRREARTTVLVTHDVGEAFQLADRIVVYDRGRVVQSAPKAELLSRPASEQVARLLGVRNVLAGTVESASPQEIVLRWRGHSLSAANNAAHPYLPSPNARTAFFIRPEYIRLIRKDRPAGEHTREMNVFSGSVVGEIDLGTSYAVLFTLDRAAAEASAAPAGNNGAAPGYDLEIDVPKLVYEMLGVARDRRWQVAIQRSAVQVLPS
jgi:molybdate transport system ATP-binding protein